MKKAFLLLAGAALLNGSLIAAELESMRKAPELAFNIPGQGQKLLSQYRGKVVALEFIWTTCPHCQAASRLMTKLQQEYGPRGFQALDIAVNANADLLVENFVKDFQVGFPVGWVLQPEMVSFMGFNSDRYVVPQLVLIDRKGFIHYQTPQKEDPNWDALMKEDSIRQHIEQLLSPGNSAQRHTSGSSRLALAKKGP
ncbi:MAG: TlpA family protein disulfide reductase [Acidobacteriaceae bacterium]|nr:TlpA family protein disulfide reductase [Acidobacteriaceae bacterium]